MISCAEIVLPITAMSDKQRIESKAKSSATSGQSDAPADEEKIYFLPPKFPDAVNVTASGVFATIRRSIRFMERIRTWKAAQEILASGLFDPEYYRLSVPYFAGRSDESAIVHYMVEGAWYCLDPHPLFSTSYYLSNNPDVVSWGINPLLHFLRSGALECRDPHPLFDCKFYVGQAGALSKHPNPLRDYLNQAEGTRPDPHPLFSNKYYDQQRPSKSINPLIDYLLRGAHCGRSPHPLFDNSFYIDRNPDVLARGMHPMRHFLSFGVPERRDPNPLFSIDYYLSQHPELENSGVNPLIHYATTGYKQGSRPHILFDPQYYEAQLSEGSRIEADYLSHYLTAGWKEGLNPCPLFDSDFYLKHNPDVSRARTNPLVHYIYFGDREGRCTSALFSPHYYRVRYRDVEKSKLAALEHYLRYGIKQGRNTSGGFSPAFLALRGNSAHYLRPFSADIKWPAGFDTGSAGSRLPLRLFCVYGEVHIPFLTKVAFPHYQRESESAKIELHLLNYRGNKALFPVQNKPGNFKVFDWSKAREDVHIGFGAGHNCLFSKVQPEDGFTIVNPDSYPMQGCLLRLFNTLAATNAGIVEARQWPAEHPKEYNPATGATPWASGAYCCISSAAFKAIGGFDERLFLYTEDVDLSWRMWCAGFPVIYEREAFCCHLTGHLTYRPDRFYHENFMCVRNFLYMAKKYFGVEGEALAQKMLKHAKYPRKFKADVLASWQNVSSECIPLGAGFDHQAVMIYGVNLYHRLHADVYPRQNQMETKAA